MYTINFLIALTLYFNYFFMENIKFDDVLGKHLSVAEKILDTNFKSNSFKRNDFKIKFHSNINPLFRDFYGMKYDFVTILTDEEDVIKSVTIHFSKIIDREFYDLFNKDYGSPKHIQVIENRKIISEIKGEGFFHNIKKSTFDLREGTFEENPIYIIWEKDRCLIKAFLRQQNMSEITFSLTEL